MEERTIQELSSFLKIEDNFLARALLLLINIFVPYGTLKNIYDATILDIGQPLISALLTLFAYSAPTLVCGFMIYGNKGKLNKRKFEEIYLLSLLYPFYYFI